MFDLFLFPQDTPVLVVKETLPRKLPVLQILGKLLGVLPAPVFFQ